MIRKTLAALVLAAATAVAGIVSTANAQEFPVDDERDFTGSWYVPDSPGHGLLIDDAPEGYVIYWFNYTTDVPFLEPGQAWFITEAMPSINDVFPLFRPTGTFNGQGGFDVGPEIGLLTIEVPNIPAVVGAEEVLLVTYQFLDFGPCTNPPFSPVWPGCSETLEFVRLTRRPTDGPPES